jgi:CHAT domain-containing protein/Tfp pilus assembly protein PilF
MSHTVASRSQLRIHNIVTVLFGVLLAPCLSAAANIAEQQSLQTSPHEFYPAKSWLATQDDKESRILELGKPIERELAGEQTHSYQLTLVAGQFLHLVVDQRGIDVVVIVYGPDGKKLVEVDSPNGAHGEEPVMLVTETSGRYRLEVRSLDKNTAAGRYEVRIENLQVATLRDKSLAAANKLYADAVTLQGDGSAASLEKALTNYQESLLLWRDLDSRSKEAEILDNMGTIYRSLGEHQKALDSHNQALTLERELGARAREAIVLSNIGFVYSDLSENQKALDFYHRTLSIQREISDRNGEQITLNNIGIVYDDLGEKLQALDHYNQSLQIQRELGAPQGDATTLNNIGVVYMDVGENQKALDYHNQALQLRRTAGDRRGEAQSLSNIGRVYGHLGDEQRSLDYYTQALLLRREVGDRRGEAVTLNNIGVVYLELDEKQKALDYLNQALQLGRTVGNRQGEGKTLNNIGLSYNRLGEQQKALDYYNQALALFRIVGDRLGEASILNDLGKVYDDRGEKQKAIDHYNQSLSLARIVGDRQTEATTLNSIARYERNRGELIAARSRSEDALNIIESLRAKIGSPEMRATYSASLQEFYQFYIDLLMGLHKRRPAEGHDAAALRASERARARSLLEILAEARADIRQGIYPVLLERERTLQLRLNAKSERQLRLRGSEPAKAQAEGVTQEVAGLQNEIRALTTEYQQVQAQIRVKNPRYAALTQPQPLSLKEIQQMLDPDTLLLEYALGEERSYLWAVTPTTLNSFELPKQVEIKTAAMRVYGLLTARNRRGVGETADARRVRIEEADAEYDKASAVLSEMILKPVGAQLGNKRLVIVSDGALQYIPFAALPTPATLPNLRTEANPPLMVKHEIVNLPSASTLSVLRHELAVRKPAAMTLAVLADPVFDKDDERVKAVSVAKNPVTQAASTSEIAFRRDIARAMEDSDGNFRFPPSRLAAAHWEAEEISKLVPARERMQALDFAANRRTAISPELSQYRIVHFATHAFIDSAHPELSGIVLSLVNERGEPQDGFLRVNDIFNLKLPAELVVLSACQTGLGKQVKGEGMIGMTRGFMYAGAPRIVVSLWSVDDRATSALMARFYKKMLGREKQPPSAALRVAQIEMWKETGWKAPYFWAGFIFQGEWNKPRPKTTLQLRASRPR